MIKQNNSHSTKICLLQFLMHANLIHANIVFAVITLQRDLSADAMTIMKEKRALVGIIIPIHSGTCSFHGNTRKCMHAYMRSYTCTQAPVFFY